MQLSKWGLELAPSKVFHTKDQWYTRIATNHQTRIMRCYEKLISVEMNILELRTMKTSHHVI